MADMKTAMIAYAMLDPRVSELESDMASITNPMLVKGTVDTVEDLEDIENPEPGWVYLVGLVDDPNKKEYVYTTAGTWDFLGYQQPIDDELSITSENAVQNKVVTVAINGKAALTIIAAEFDATVTYSAGKIVLKDSELYVYTASQASSGAWDASKWTAITIGDQLEAKANSADLATVAFSGSYTDLSDKPTIPSIAGLAKETALADEYDEQTTYADGDYYVLDGELYKIVSGITTKITVGSEFDTKQNALTFDTTPTSSSTNPVTSGGIKEALDLKADTSVTVRAFKTADIYDSVSGTYAVNDTTVESGVLYICIEAVSTPEAFDSTKWVAVTNSSGLTYLQPITNAAYTALLTKDANTLYAIM